MLADRLSRYGRSLCDDDLSGTVVHEVKRRVMDCPGCALGTWNAPPYRIARQLAQVVTVPHGATVWGTGHRTLPDLAAFANGAHVIEQQDHNRLIRPRPLYTEPTTRDYVPLDRRS